MKKLYCFLSVLVIASGMLSCTTKEVVIDERYLKLSDATMTFLQEGNETQEITVRANPKSFQATPNAVWIKVEDQTENGITVTVDPNEGIERASTITIKSGDTERIVAVKQLGHDGMNGRCRILNTWKNAVLSPNGKYLGGVYIDIAPDDSFIYYAVIRDLETDEDKVFGPYPASLFTLGDAGGISDTGVLLVGATSGGVGCVGFDINDDDYFRIQPVPECSGAPVLYKTSSDGSVWVGYVAGSPQKVTYAPVKYVDGIPELLPLPEHNFRFEKLWAGVIARGVSADGSVIYGSTWENYDYGMVYYKDGEVRWVGEDVRELVDVVTLYNGLGDPYEYHLVNGMTSASEKYMVSPNGKWIGGMYRTETLADDKESILQSNYPAFYNTETETTTIFRELGGCMALGATDDGIGLVGNGTSLITSGRLVDIESGTVIGDMGDWIKENYGIVQPNGFIQYISSDGKVILGRMQMIAAQGVSYINYYIAPPLN